MRLTRKQFLSDSPDETGFIVITAMSPRVEDMKECSWYSDNTTVESQVQIGDCNSKVYLNFDVKDEVSLKKRIDKLSILINNLQELKDTLPILWDDAKVTAEIYKELNKEGSEAAKENEKLSTN
jgi:hypothetical protein